MYFSIKTKQKAAKIIYVQKNDQQLNN